MKKIAVMFPGVGYTCRKPLLYYTASAAEEEGYETIRLDYGEDIHSFRGRSMEELGPVIETALHRVLPVLRDIRWEAYEDVLFVSKSIGTVVACRAAQELGIQAYQFLMTPILATLPYLGRVQGVFFAGTKDPYIPSEMVRNAAKEHPEMAVGIYEGCNHSLEKPGDVLTGLDNLREVVAVLKKHLEESGRSRGEWLDVVDELGIPTGERVERKEAHRKGIRHRTAHVWLMRDRGKGAEVLLQKRSRTKDSHPGCYDISSAGHIPAGVEWIPSAIRELKEELGLDVEPQEFLFCGQRSIRWEDCFYNEPFRDHQISNVYCVWKDVEEAKMTLQEEEVEEVCWMLLKECKERVRNNTMKHCISPEELEMLPEALWDDIR